MKKLAIVTTHPIQYNAPWFRMLTERNRISVGVFYTWGQLENGEKFDPGFGKAVAWDIPVLSGYRYTFVKNVSRDPGSHHYGGIDNPSLVHEIESWNPDAILVFGWNFKSHLACIRHFHGKVPVYFRGDSTLLDERRGRPVKKWLKKTWLTWMYRRIDAVFYVGQANRAYFSYYGVPPEKLVFAPHAIDNERFATDTGSFRHAWGIPDDAIVFLFAGKFEQKKDPQLLLDAFMQLNHAGTFLVFAGNGRLEHKLMEQAKASPQDVQNRIKFVDFQNQQAMPAVYRSADVFVLPSQGPGETWGLSVNEAMACGRATLVSDRCGCHDDLVEAGRNGWVFRSGDKQDLAAKMKTLSECRKLDDMGRASSEKIRDWSFEHICQAIENRFLKEEH